MSKCSGCGVRVVIVKVEGCELNSCFFIFYDILTILDPGAGWIKSRWKGAYTYCSGNAASLVGRLGSQNEFCAAVWQSGGTGVWGLGMVIHHGLDTTAVAHHYLLPSFVGAFTQLSQQSHCPPPPPDLPAE